jgi:ribosomal protein L39E
MKKTQMTSMLYKLMKKEHQQKPFEAWKQAKTTHIIRKHRQQNEKNVIEKDCKWQ